MAISKYPRGIRYQAQYGRWELKFQKRKEIYYHHFTAEENKTNLAKAVRLLNQARANVRDDLPPWPEENRSGANPDGESFTFRDVAKLWLSDLETRSKSSNVTESRRIINGVWLAEFQDVPVENLSARRLKRTIKAMNWSSVKRRRNCCSVLRQILEFAVDDLDVLDANPLPSEKRRGGKSQATTFEPKPFSVKEKAAILRDLKKMNREAWLFHLIAFETGARTGEVLALTWDDFDFANGDVSITKAIVRSEVTTTKTYKSRTVAMTAELANALKGEVRPLDGGPLWIAEQTGAQRKSAKHFRKWWVRALDSAKVDYRRMYTTRSTRATELLSAGVPVKIVAAQLGHTEQVCQQRYSGLYVTGNERDVLRAAEKRIAGWK